MGPSPAALQPEPSPNAPLNTPGNPYSVGSLTSPAGITAPPAGSELEERMYLEKLKELQKYIEPLRRMIRRIEHAEDRKRDQRKMKNLLDILLDTTRMSIPALLKCEEVLKKLHQEPPGPSPSTSSGQAVSAAGTSSAATSIEADTSGASAAAEAAARSGFVPVPKPGAPMCQTLLDTVAAHIKSPQINHTLARTFKPALNALHGPDVQSFSPPTKRRRSSPSPPPGELPHVLQGEIARLAHKYSITVEQSQIRTDASKVHLVCRLTDCLLPTVPPISVAIPENYPQGSPEWVPAPHDYGKPRCQCRIQF